MVSRNQLLHHGRNLKNFATLEEGNNLEEMFHRGLKKERGKKDTDI